MSEKSIEHCLYNCACPECDTSKARASTPIADLVKADIDARVEKGIETYGKPLFPHNGRDALRDAYEEAIDLAKYLRQALYERDGK